VVACLLWSDAACFLQTAQAAGRVAGHDVATRQVDVVVATADGGYRVRELDMRRTTDSFRPVFELHGDGYLRATLEGPNASP
jgi:hypothetical protein